MSKLCTLNIFNSPEFIFFQVGRKLISYNMGAVSESGPLFICIVFIREISKMQVYFSPLWCTLLMRNTESHPNFLLIFFHPERYLVRNVQPVERLPFWKHETTFDYTQVHYLPVKRKESIIIQPPNTTRTSWFEPKKTFDQRSNII